MRMARAYDEEDHPLSGRGIEQNEGLLRRYREFRCGADAVAAAWRAHPEVLAVSLIGSVARAPWKLLGSIAPRADRPRPQDRGAGVASGQVRALFQAGQEAARAR